MKLGTLVILLLSICLFFFAVMFIIHLTCECEALNVFLPSN